jgi:hypothetical protein
MDRETVSSSNLVSVGYDPQSETLEVEFTISGVYQYFNVPPFMWERLMSADSVGRFFNLEIRNAYPCAKA